MFSYISYWNAHVEMYPNLFVSLLSLTELRKYIIIHAILSSHKMSLKRNLRVLTLFLLRNLLRNSRMGDRTHIATEK